MDSQVHFTETYSLIDTFLSIDAHFCAGVGLMLHNEASTLDEHSTRPTRRIKDTSVKGLHHLNNEFDERRWRKEFPAFGTFRHRKFAQEIFIDFPEGVSFDIHGDRGEIFQERDQG